MLYSSDLGITATKAELAAILQFTVETEANGWVAFAVEEGALIASANNGSAAVSHRSDALNGRGGKSDDEFEWQVSSDLLKRLAKGMKPQDELVLTLDRKRGKLSHAIVREIESGEAKSKTDLAGHTNDQATIAATRVTSYKPRASSPFPTVALDPRLLGLVTKVGRAHGSASCRWVIPPDERSPIHVEIDSAENLAAESTPAWSVVIGQLALGEEDVSPERSAADRVRSKGHA